MFVNPFMIFHSLIQKPRLWQHVEIQARDSEQWIPMNADAAAAEVVNHQVEIKIEMNMKTILKITVMKIQMNTREIVT